MTLRNLMFDSRSRVRGSQPTALSRDRVEAALRVAITTPARCHIELSGAARLGHPPTK